MSPLAAVGVLCLAALLLYLLAMHYDPQKPHARWLRHGVTGLMLLMLWNLLPLPHLGINPLSVMVTGALGMPGLGLTVFLNLAP